MAKALPKAEADGRPQEERDELLRGLVRRVAQDAVQRAPRYPGDSLVPEGGE